MAGTAIARELSHYQLKICLLKKGTDVATRTFKANSGIIYAGYNAAKETLKSRLNIESNPYSTRLLGISKCPLSALASLVVAFAKEDISRLKQEKQAGLESGITGLEILN